MVAVRFTVHSQAITRILCTATLRSTSAIVVAIPVVLTAVFRGARATVDHPSGHTQRARSEKRNADKKSYRCPACHQFQVRVLGEAVQR